MANNYGVQYNSGYVTTPAGGGIGTDSSGVRRSFVDTFASGTGTTLADGGVQNGENIAVGVKLRPGSRIIGATLCTNGNGGATSCVGTLSVTDNSGTTALTASANMQAGSPLTRTLTDAHLQAGGYVCDGEGTLNVLITGADLDTGGDGVLSVFVDYLDI